MSPMRGHGGEEGYTAYKIKVGMDHPSDDAARTRAIREALGSDCLVMADANQAWTVRQAISYLSCLDEGNHRHARAAARRSRSGGHGPGEHGQQSEVGR